MKLAISIPTYNRKESLNLLLDSIFSEIKDIKSDYFQIDVFIFDNCSTDGTKDFIKGIYANHNNVNYCRNEINYGLLVNITKAMFTPISDYLLLLPDDAILERNSLKRIIDIIQSQQPDIVVLNRFDSFGDKIYSDIGDLFNEHFNKITWIGGYVFNQESFQYKNFFKVAKSWFPHIEYILNNRKMIKRIVYLKNDIVRKNESVSNNYLLMDHWYDILLYLDYINYEYGIKIKHNAYKKFLDMIETNLISVMSNKPYYLENKSKIDSIINKYPIYSFSSYIKLSIYKWVIMFLPKPVKAVLRPLRRRFG
ncbi:glycosyltransferase [Dehalococcoidia bacterium]|nr:glycosyltransferase [Dehalococcoidia bacterium]